MNKTISTVFFATFCLILLSLVARADIVISNHNSNLSVYRGDSVSGYFTLNNTGNETIAISTSATNLPSNSRIYFTINNTNLVPNTPTTINFVIKTDTDATQGNSTVTINATSTSSYSFNLEVKRSLFNLDISDPSNGDNYDVGDNVSVSLNLDAKEDIDFTITAEILDSDGNSITDDSLDDSLNDGDNQDYDFYLKIPTDVDSGTYYLKVTVEADGTDSHHQVMEQSLRLDVSKKRDKLVIDKDTYSGLPTCGQQLTFDIKISNSGTRNQDNTVVTISNSDLGIDLQQTADINSGSSKTFHFSPNIPNITPGTYEINVDASSDRTSEQDTIELDLQNNCKSQVDDVSITPKPTSYYVGQENTAIITLVNTGDKTETYNLNVSGLTSWATLIGIQTPQVTLAPGQSQDVFVTFKPNENAASLNTFILTTKFGAQVKTQIIQVPLQSKSTQGSGSLFEQLSSSLQKESWLFILNIVLVIVAIILIILVFTRRQPRVQQVEPSEARLKGNKKGKKK